MGLSPPAPKQEASTPETLASEVLRGDVPATARACRWVDDHHAHSAALLKALYPSTGKGWRIGITGNPGAGKSTLVDQLIGLLRAMGKRVGVVAVDPSSPFSGGAILGDRIRMQRHVEDPEVFIRSLASRGDLGGISSTTFDVARVLEAWGAQVVIIETVGVGQAEVDVMCVADTTLVVVPPGLGDHVQAAKAGLLEVADAFALNKADQIGADATLRDLETMIALGDTVSVVAYSQPGHSAALPGSDSSSVDGSTWRPCVIRTVATTGAGTGELLAELQRHAAWLNGTQAGHDRRRQRTSWELAARLGAAVTRAFRADFQPEIEAMVRLIEAGQQDPYAASDELLRRFRQLHRN